MVVEAESEISLGLDLQIDRSRPAVPQIYRQLRTMIVRLHLAPNTPLSPADLARSGGVSPTPVREALLRLEEEGFIVIKPQSGTFVAPIDVQRALEARFMRMCVELEVARLLCARVDDADIHELRANLDRQRQAFVSQDATLFDLEDEAFHAILYRHAGVDGLWQTVSPLRAQYDRLRRLHYPVPGKQSSILAEHTAITDAIANRDAAAADRAVRRHLSGTIHSIDELAERYPGYIALETDRLAGTK